jgi:hypothetical protein
MKNLKNFNQLNERNLFHKNTNMDNLVLKLIENIDNIEFDINPSNKEDGYMFKVYFIYQDKEFYIELQDEDSDFVNNRLYYKKNDNSYHINIESKYLNKFYKVLLKKVPIDKNSNDDTKIGNDFDLR